MAHRRGFPPVKTNDMVKVAGGTFRMGSDAHYPEEAPVHRVSVDTFWIDTTPVTNRQFRAFVKATGHRTTAETAPRPEDYPGALPHMLRAGSLTFRPPAGPFSMDNFYSWWDYTFGADWKHPYGPKSTIIGFEEHPVVHVSYADALAYARQISPLPPHPILGYDTLQVTVILEFSMENRIPRSDSIRFHRDAANPQFPDAPDGLTEDQADHFHALSHCLHAADINEIIVLQLREAAVLWTQVRDMTVALDAEGSIIVGPKGQYQNPKINARRALHGQYLSACRLAGIDQIKRVQKLAERSALSELRRTEGSQAALPVDQAASESLFARPVVHDANPRRAVSIADLSYDEIYGPNAKN